MTETEQLKAENELLKKQAEVLRDLCDLKDAQMAEMHKLPYCPPITVVPCPYPVPVPQPYIDRQPWNPFYPTVTWITTTGTSTTSAKDSFTPMKRTAGA